jgi:hypothetical protein
MLRSLSVASTHASHVPQLLPVIVVRSIRREPVAALILHTLVVQHCAMV